MKAAFEVELLEEVIIFLRELNDKEGEIQKAEKIRGIYVRKKGLE